MSPMLKSVARFLFREDGPTAVEYAVMLALILVVCIAIVTQLGTTISGTFRKVNTSTVPTPPVSTRPADD